MKNKWFLGILSAVILTMAVVFILPPVNVHGQAIGYTATGQQAVTATATVVSGISYGTVCIKALSTNSISVFIGGSGVTTATGFELTATQVPYCATVNKLPFYVIASTTGASVSWIENR